MPDQTRRRLQDLVHLLQHHSNGLTTPDIAVELNVTRQTALKDIDRLTRDGFPIYMEGNRYLLDPSYQTELHLSLAQAWFMYLPLRRIVRARLHRYPLVRSLLYQVAALFQDELAQQLAPPIGADEIDSEYDDVFVRLVQGWEQQRQVRVTYRKLNADRATRLTVEPWWFEPAVWSDAFYLIAGVPRGDGKSDPLTLKLDRIQSVEILNTHFDRPTGDAVTEYLEKTWGIWVGDDQSTEVVLRFAGYQKDRLLETRWHPSETIQQEEDGTIIWRATVSEPQEMLPWIRGWGADVEVLAPPALRQALMQEAKELALLYGVGSTPPLQPRDVLWAKYEAESGQVHLLLYHLIDVAQVALAMWNEVLGDGVKNFVSQALGLDVDATGRLLAFLAGIHDLGKASPVFQVKNPVVVTKLRRMGLEISTSPLEYVPHGRISTYALQRDLLEQGLGIPRRISRKLAVAVGGHHGQWPTPSELQRPTDSRPEIVGGPEWDDARHDLFEALQQEIQPPLATNWTVTQEQLNAFLAWFSGFTSVVDWLGSNQDYFDFESSVQPVHDYALRAADRARQALLSLGWMGWRSAGNPRAFEDLFPFAPNAVQRDVCAVEPDVVPPALAIVEAPTGSGKTEAALYLADRWLQQAGGNGLYVAMPTQATSNQMYGRVLDFLKQCYPGTLINVQLVHGQSAWADDVPRLQLWDGNQADGDGAVAAMSWFAPKKRSLLAPFGVGTVDQALVSILLTKHFFVRLYGLSHKVVIFDEVHAYDTYMSTLFRQLLEWLRQLGVSVILLSATLPEKTRTALLESYTGRKESADLADQVPYPRLTLASGHQPIRSIPLSPPPSRIITLDWVTPEPAAIVECLRANLADGGCAAVICNTVRRAQEVFSALEQAALVPSENLYLFHAQFPYVWRDALEHEVLGAFSKKGLRPHRAILVATQVVEQSLDLDFDLMITDLAPVDLVLQRAGRLHRHAERSRPALLASPHLYLTGALWREDGLPDFGSSHYVYDEFVLAATLLCLENRQQLVIPDDTTEIIEQVYGEEAWINDQEDPLRRYLSEARDVMNAKFHEEKTLASTKYVFSPQDERLLAQENPALDEDDATVRQVFQAMTRLIEPGVDLVCLHRTVDGIALEPDGSGLFDPFDPLSRELEKQLLQRKVTVRTRAIISTLAAQPVPEAWTRSAGLRYCRLIVFDAGRYTVPGTSFVLYLSKTYGLEIRKED